MPLDPTSSLHESVRQIRQAVQALRESVTQAVMRRNMLADQVASLDTQISDLDAKTALAERINNKSLADEIRAERDRVIIERDRVRVILTEAEVAAETAKMNLPEEEAKLLRQANDLKAKFAQNAASTLDTGRTDTSDMLDRALDKIRGLQSEAAARSQVAPSGNGAPPILRLDPASVDKSAEEMLAALETRLGTPVPVSAPGAAPTAAEAAEALPSRVISVEAPRQEPETAPAPTLKIADIQAPAVEPAPAEVSLSLSEPAEEPVAETPPPAEETADAQAAEPATDSGTEAAAVEAAPVVETPKPTLNIISRGDSSLMESRVRVAAIGTGGIFRGAHMPAYPEIPQAQLVALCDPDPVAQKAAMARYHSLYEARIAKAKDQGDTATADRLQRDIDAVKVYNDISEVIAEVKPDLVDVCTQPVLHTPLSIKALLAGINVMCEKPISRSWLETKRLKSAIQASGKLYQHNENWLWDADYYTAQKLIRAGAIGEPIFMFLTQAHGGPEGNPKFWNSDFGGGGSLLDNGIHAIGAVWFMSGLEKRPTLVKAAAPFGMQIRMPHRIIEGRYQQVRVDDDAHILIRFEDPDTLAWTTAHVEGSWSEQDSPDTLIQGTIGSIKYVNTDGRRYAVITDANGIETRRIGVSGPTWQFWPSSFYGEILNMVECVRNGLQSISSAQFGADCSAIVGCSYLSQKRGKRAVTLQEFEAFANEIESRYSGDPVGADNALVEALLSAVR